MRALFGVALCALFLAGGCASEKKKRASKSRDAGVKAQAPLSDAAVGSHRWYRLIVMDDRFLMVPFFLGVAPDGNSVVFDNGGERVSYAAKVGPTSIVVQFPVNGSELSLKLDGFRASGKFRNVFRGKWSLTLDIDGREVPHVAPHILFPGPPAAEFIDVSGNWLIDLGEFGAGVVIINQSDDGVIDGSLIVSGLGDSRSMRGRVTGRQLRMAQFDGTKALLLSGWVAGDGASFEGELVFPGLDVFAARGVRGDSMTVLKILEGKLTDGKTLTLPELDARPDLAGKPVIVDLFGTWCSACRDATPALVALHERYAPQGLEVLGIAVEPNYDATAAKRRVRALAERFGIPWDISLRLVDDVADAMPEEIQAGGGYPVTIFLRRDHSVAAIHSSFVSKAAGEEHAKLLKQFDAWTQEIVTSDPKR